MGKPTDTGGEALDQTLLDFFAGQELCGFVSAAAFNQNAEEMLKKAGVDPTKAKP